MEHTYMVREIIKILDRTFGRHDYKIIEFNLIRAIMRVPSIPHLFNIHYIFFNFLH